MPVIGGVAIALAVLFFFKAMRTGKMTTANKNEQALETLHEVPSARADRENQPQQDISPPIAQEKVVLEKGKTLRLLSLDLFGSKEFWVYIYLENRDKIHNPNTVPIGAELLVPDRTVYSIDATDTEAIAKARSLAEEILKKFTD